MTSSFIKQKNVTFYTMFNFVFMLLMSKIIIDSVLLCWG